MINTLAVGNYRSLLDLKVPFGSLNVITGDNASGKSNLYKALRLLSETAQGGVVNSLAREGGLSSTFWAGPETITKRMRTGEVPVQGSHSQKAARLRLGFAAEQLSYSISLGLPIPGLTMFSQDPEIKRECIWAGTAYRPASLLVDRSGPVLKVRDGRSWDVVFQHASAFESMFNLPINSEKAPEMMALREQIRAWRFYDHFRTDSQAPARQPQLGTRTPVLSHDGHDLAAALQTIIEIGDAQALSVAVTDAFPGASLAVSGEDGGRFGIAFSQDGLLRPLSAAELSDGTLRYLLWIAALLTPRPPPLTVLNEPETSLHPDLLPALARLIIKAASSTQVWVVSHASRLIAALESAESCNSLHLNKELGQTKIIDQDLLNTPAWSWPDAAK